MGEIPPSATIGILGGGQLGRMLCQAAARLGYRTHIYCPEVGAPASVVASSTTVASYEDSVSLAAFAQSVDVVTFEFENIPAQALELIQRETTVRPSPQILEVTQDRLAEKSLCQTLGIPTAPFAVVSSSDDCAGALATTGLPAILKTRRLGYDGKGQRLIRSTSDLESAWMDLGAGDCILEGFVDFEHEISVIIARGPTGTVATYDIPENLHRDGILRESRVPSSVGGATFETARDIAHRLVAALDYVGVGAVEMFATKDGTVLVNEIAPRVHNSGHWTIDACATDQFEQHIRAICGLPLGSTVRAFDIVMTNLIGPDANDWRSYLDDPLTKLHLYGKSEVRAGRKMGHVTKLSVIAR
ncbi:MAG: 5-(carboxyamino)imidazole ribonucleotide synthase [Alphaproteobacteria bacterium]|nr:5-(carboxyamino)imidazole ribonucleotide synthase [Alphaproteobacteria bacterium]